MPSLLLPVESNRPIAGDDVWQLSIRCNDTPKAGQFYMLRCENSAVLLPRAISLCDAVGEERHFLYKVVGKGTAALARLREGHMLRVIGPLGNGFPLDELTGRIALVGGGVGVAPLLHTARQLGERGIKADAYLGYPDLPYLTGEFMEAAGAVHIASESGAVGYKGFVTELLDAAQYGSVLCCGPTPMMKAAVALCERAGTPIWVSLENKMACGVGACLVCACADKQGNNRRTCKDGPVFRGEEICFDA